MKAIIFADCHYGYKDGAKVSIEEVVKLYEKEYDDVDKVIVLGDFIDLWRRSIDDVLIENSNVIDYLESWGKSAIYVKGNHDFIIDELLRDRKINIVDRYKVKGHMFEHGHYIDYLSMDKPFVSIDDFYAFAKEMCYSDNTTGKFLSRMWKMYKLLCNGFGSALFRYSSKADNKFNKMDKLSHVLYGKSRRLVIGHFHRLWVGDNLISLPAFCDGYFAVFNNGEFVCYRMQSDDNIVRV